MPRISKRTVDAATPLDGKRQILWDDKLAGFGLLVLPTGTKSFVFDYRNAHGIKRRATIGKVGSITPEKARDRAKDMAEAVRYGRDPLAERQQMRQAATVGEIFDAYLASEAFKDKAASTRAIDTGRIERHLRPLLGKKQVEGLREEDVKRVFAAIRDGKTADKIKTKKRGLARVTGGEGTARMAIRLLRAILGWAVREHRAKENPAAGIKIGNDGQRDTILDNPEQYARLFSTLAAMEAEKRIRPAVADAVRLVALTGARRGEVANMRWCHVDLKSGVVILPPTAHKTGKISGKPRIIGLPAYAQQIVARQPPGGADDFVFRPSKGEGAVELSKAWRVIRKEADLPEGIGLHGLRHSIGSSMAMAGAAAPEIMAQLGHSDFSMSQRYIHWVEEARVAIAEKAAATALAGFAAASGKPSAQVVALPAKEGTG